jgi:hypothetical protein
VEFTFGWCYCCIPPTGNFIYCRDRTTVYLKLVGESNVPTLQFLIVSGICRLLILHLLDVGYNAPFVRLHDS